jgi:16S rRNA (cytosine967-C5)-methyltransferase
MQRPMADPTRNSAFDILTAVLDQHRPLEDALDALTATDSRDRAAGHRIAAAVLRRTGSLDAVLEPFLRREPPAPVRHILRLGAAQLLLLETPAHAAVATSVALARARGLAPFAGLANAVLRRVAEAGQAALAELDGPRLDTPPWLWASWGSHARAIATAHAAEAPIDLTIQTDAPPGGEQLALTTVRYPSGTRIVELPGFIEGAFWVQDFAATLPAHLLAAIPGERVADLCAAPGGKAAQLSATGANVTAVEHNPHRIARLRENLDRLQMAPTIVQADATTWQPAEKFDAVLLDAPCSATGTIRRHPDVPHLKRPRDLIGLAAQQDAMLVNAAAMLRPGGRLVYAVCSLQPEEGQQRLASAAAAGLRHDPFRPEELAFLPEARTPDGCLRTYPSFWSDRGGMDGFFAARFVRL